MEWRLGNYEILEELGRGGMGIIYRARQRHSGRIVALKRVLAYQANSPENLARFRREVQVAASLDHPNILPIYEVSECEDGIPFFTMKLAIGGSLRDASTELRRSPRQCVALIAKVAGAVQHAHDKGVLHRDLKPDNILLDGRGEPLVSDFGLAKRLEASNDLARTVTISGTPGYVAPEQAKGYPERLSTKSDVYSLGAMLFALIAGRPPFLGRHALSAVLQAFKQPAPRLRLFSKLADRDLETICARALEQEPSARYPTAQDFAEDLERWLDGRCISARRVFPLTRGWRWSRRNPVLAITGVSCVLITGAGLCRHLESRRLASIVRDKELAAHSAIVLPFLNLDDGTADLEISNRIASALEKQAMEVGAVRIQSMPELPPHWTGIGDFEEIRLAAKQFNAKAALTGSKRQVRGKTRLFLRLVQESGNDLLGVWTIDINHEKEIGGSLGALGAGHQLYALFGATTDSRPVDEGILDGTARSYVDAGRGLLDRRTILDMDRAIECFQGAIRTAPRSVMAHSYLALAYMGRNLLTRNQHFIDRAFEAAHKAVELSPNDSFANQSLSALYISTGHYDEALGHAFRSLEAANPTARAFGHIAYAWKMLGRPDKAISWFQKAMGPNRKLADYDALVGDCWTLLGADTLARESFETAQRFRPDLPEGWLGLCNLRLIQGDTRGARELYQERFNEYGHFHAARQMGAEIAFFSRNFAEAEELYGKLQLADAHGDGSEQYGVLSYQSAIARLKKNSNDPSYAVLIRDCRATELSKLARSPKHPEILYRLAATAAIADDTDSALSYIRAAIAAGWTDHRSPRIDPRFDSMLAIPAFQETLDDLAIHVLALRNRLTADVSDLGRE